WGQPPLEPLLEAAGEAPGGRLFDVHDPRFVAPADMAAEVSAAAGLRGAEPAVIVRSIVESQAHAVAGVARQLAAVTGEQHEEVVVVGGGGRNRLLNRCIEEATGLPVRCGPVEATALGNALVQGVAVGRYPD